MFASIINVKRHYTIVLNPECGRSCGNSCQTTFIVDAYAFAINVTEFVVAVISKTLQCGSDAELRPILCIVELHSTEPSEPT